jgi:hypothetical protein
VSETISAPTHFIGVCDNCRTVKAFDSEQDRDLWMRHHPHGDGPRMSEQPDLSTLPKRMRYAATVLREADARYDFNKVWPVEELEGFADQWEAEDRANGERDAMAEELAKTMFDIFAVRDLNDEPPRNMARWLVDQGWRKGDPA